MDEKVKIREILRFRPVRIASYDIIYESCVGRFYNMFLEYISYFLPDSGRNNILCNDTGTQR